MYARWGIEDGLQAMAYGPLCRGLGWTRDRVEVLLGEVRGCLRILDRGMDRGDSDVDEDGEVKAYLPFHVWCGQKPFDRREGMENDEVMEVDEAMDMG